MIEGVQIEYGHRKETLVCRTAEDNEIYYSKGITNSFERFHAVKILHLLTLDISYILNLITLFYLLSNRYTVTFYFKTLI